MNTLELFLIAISLSMDAFAVSICKGLLAPRSQWKNALIAGTYFGFFQAFMPLLGYLLGIRFQNAIQNIDHWIAFVLLALIGGNMVRESLHPKEEEQNASFSPKAMLPLAVATSIDALAVGVTFAFLSVTIIPAVSIIGITTFLFGVLGVRIGKLFGNRLKSKAEFFGGIILVGMGIKILIEHLFF